MEIKSALALAVNKQTTNTAIQSLLKTLKFFMSFLLLFKKFVKVLAHFVRMDVYLWELNRTGAFLISYPSPSFVAIWPPAKQRIDDKGTGDRMSRKKPRITPRNLKDFGD
jgi:hypothetical protein